MHFRQIQHNLTCSEDLGETLGGRKPSDQPANLGCESADNWHLASRSTIAIYYYNQPKSYHSFYHLTEGRRLSRPRHCWKVVAACAKDCIS